jgi:hypothetical protein
VLHLADSTGATAYILHNRKIPFPGTNIQAKFIKTILRTSH